MFPNFLAKRYMESIAKPIIDQVLATYDAVKKGNQKASEASLLIMTLDNLKTCSSPQVLQKVHNKYCNSLEGICYFMAIELGKGMEGQAVFRIIQFTHIIDKLLYQRGVTPQREHIRAQLFEAMHLPERGWERF